MSEILRLNTQGPHSDDYTVQLGWGLAEVVRVLNYATQCRAGLTAPSTAYDVLGATKTAAQRLPQLLQQLEDFLDRQLETGHLADAGSELHPVFAVEAARLELQDARAAAGSLEWALERAQQAINGLYIPDDGGQDEEQDGPYGDGEGEARS